MSSDADLARSIEELKAEINGLERSILGVRYEDFKKVVLTQIQYIITGYYNEYLASNLERIDCVSTCPYRKDCRKGLNDIFQGISASFLRDDFETPLQELDRAETIISGLHSPCQSKDCHELQSGMVRDVRALVIFVQKLFERVGGQAKSPDEQKRSSVDPTSTSRMIAPLSHPARLQILQALSLRDRAFTDLSKELELRTGHLQFHMRPLLDEGYVSKQKNRGEYSITARGRTALDLADMFSSRLTMDG
ncbi:MAG TPA: winged helix-turn-helix transcriptional regulator [Methanomassiliicoccales archaeon]|nr:winged helix-turn-helix transcriptional regulator [Methanomassiliicoccales archaeon]